MPDYDHLYDVSIDTLQLSVKNQTILLRTGITSVGDCLDMYQNLGMTINHRRKVWEVMEDELHEKLMQHNYWYLTGLSPNWFD